MADTFTANMAGLRGPGLTGADKALFDAKLAAGDAQVLAAKQAATVASDAAGIDRTFASKADANTALPGLANGLIVQVLKDESQNTARTVYKVTAGAYSLIGKIAYVADDLSNVSQSVTVSFRGQKINGGVSRSLYQGGWSDFHQVNGYVAAIADYPGRHRFEGSWRANNVVVIRNRSNDDAYSAACFENNEGREGFAVGLGNSGTSYDGPFAGAAFFESSDFIKEDGSSDVANSVGRPIRGVVTCPMYRRHDKTTGHAQYGRTQWGIDGSWTFHTVHPDWSKAAQRVTFRLHAGAGFYGMTASDMDDFSPILRVRSKNGYDRGGIVVGATFEGDAGTPPPQVAADIVGTVLAGKNIDSGRATEMFYGDAQPSFCHYDSSDFVLRAVRPGVGKVDLMFAGAVAGKPLRVSFVDRDHTSIEPLWMAMDGTGKVGVGGYFAVNGKTPVAPAALPPALPTDGAATNAAMATMLNALRASLIAIGTHVAA
ncbi:hypothetical protein [Sphingomonas sp.]|uniref:hypothetical protein n=1 Tax=Sphingomonas sp. TaxID=28214 RepID=UPI0035B4D9FB